MPLYRCWFVAVVLVASSATAQVTVGTLGAQIQSAIQTNQIHLLPAAVAAACRTDIGLARDPSQTIYVRADAAKRARQCVEGARDTTVALAAQSALSGNLNAAALAPQISGILKPLADEVKSDEEKTNGWTNFMGLNWGLGFGYSFGKETVENAVIVDNIVRATETRKNEPRFVLEFHKYFWCNNKNRDGTRGCGPFVAVAASDNKVLSGVGMGLMYGLKQKKEDEDSDGFSIGFGAILDSKVKTLAEGFSKDEPLPAGETGPRFSTKSRWSALLFATKTF